MGLAVVVAAGLGLAFLWLPRLPRDLGLTVYGLIVAILGIFAMFGPPAALVGGGILLLTFVLGALIYGVLALAARWANRY